MIMLIYIYILQTVDNIIMLWHVYTYNIAKSIQTIVVPLLHSFTYLLNLVSGLFRISDEREQKRKSKNPK